MLCVCACVFVCVLFCVGMCVCVCFQFRYCASAFLDPRAATGAVTCGKGADASGVCADEVVSNSKLAANSVVIVSVTSFSRKYFTFQLLARTIPSPSNDDYAHRQALPWASGASAGTLLGATMEGLETSLELPQGGSSVW